MKTTGLAGVEIATPVLAAPMAGGPSTVELVVAAASVGSLGFLAAGYASVEQLAEQVAAARERAGAFGVNVFVPNPVPITAEAYSAYAEHLRPLAERYGVQLPATPLGDDDLFAQKVDLLRASPVPIVSLTFGIPPVDVVRALQRAGSVVAQSVTSPAEAREAQDAGVDLLVVQGHEAGGHCATLTPRSLPRAIAIGDLVAGIRAVTALPIVAGGGLVSPAQVRDVLRDGADAVMVGTALLRTPEAGTSATHRAALVDPASTETVLTRAFTGRPARGIRNDFTDRFGALAPLGYPALHHLTSGLRKAAAAAGDAGAVHLWAGTGFASCADAPAGEVLTGLAARL